MSRATVVKSDSCSRRHFHGRRLPCDHHDVRSAQLGKRIERAIQETFPSFKAFVKHLGMADASQLKRWREGSITLDNLIRVSDATGWSVDQLLGRATEPVAAPGRDPLDAETDAVAATAPRRGATGQRRRGAGDATAG